MRRSLALPLIALLGTLAGRAEAAVPRADLDRVAAMVESGNVGAAEEELRHLLTADDNPAARDLLGVLLSRQGRAAEAEAQFRGAIAADPEYAPARQHLARLLLVLQRDGEALEELRAAAQLGSLERNLALRLATFERAAGNTAAAEEQWSSVADRFGSVRALVELARARGVAGDHEGALVRLRQALEMAPNSEAVLSAHARVSLAARAPMPAIWTLEHLVRMQPEVAEYAYLLGVARMQIGEMTGAVEILEKALSLAPDRALSMIALGISLNGQKRFDEAHDILERSLLFAPDSVEALAAIAEAEEGLGRLEDAQRHAGRAIAAAPDHSRALLVIGKVRMTEGRYAEARDALELAVAADPSGTKGHYQLSLAYARLGDAESSQRHLAIYRQALEESESRLLELRSRTGIALTGADE